MRRRPALLAFAAFAVAAAAQTTDITGDKMLNPDAPINYSADRFALDRDSRVGTLNGNVIIRQGEVSMRADTVRFHYVQNKPDKIYAKGRVVVDTPSGVATGDDGVYDVNPRLITLNGHVVLTQGMNVMRGKQLVVNLLSGKASLAGGENAQGRVQGVLAPNTGPNGNR